MNYGELIAGLIIVFIVFVYIMYDTGKYVTSMITNPPHEGFAKRKSRTPKADRFEASMQSRMYQ